MTAWTQTAPSFPPPAPPRVFPSPPMSRVHSLSTDWALQGWEFRFCRRFVGLKVNLWRKPSPYDEDEVFIAKVSSFRASIHSCGLDSHASWMAPERNFSFPPAHRGLRVKKRRQRYKQNSKKIVITGFRNLPDDMKGKWEVMKTWDQTNKPCVGRAGFSRCCGFDSVTDSGLLILWRRSQRLHSMVAL